MKDGKEKSHAIKKSVSMPKDLWDFVIQQKGDFGDASRVIQKALRELQEKVERLAHEKEASGKRKISVARNEEAESPHREESQGD